jgi:hypothetical protein
MGSLMSTATLDLLGALLASPPVAPETTGGGGGLNPTTLQLLGSVFFGLAVIHTFLASKFNALAHRFREGSIGENIFHFLGEVEVVFGLWSGIFLACYAVLEGMAVYDEGHHHVVGGAIGYLEGLNYTEPAFVFVIMAMAATRPILVFAEAIIRGIAGLIPASPRMSFYVSALILGPLLGSFITEPAAMTVTALILCSTSTSPA